MARIPYFDFSQASPALAQTMQGRRPLKMYGLIGHADESAISFLGLGRSLLAASSIDAGLRELVILRTAALCGANYEVVQHRKAAARIGLAAQKVDAVVVGIDTPMRIDAFDEKECAVLQFTDAVVREVKAPQAVFERVAAVLTHRQIVELLMIIGFYMMASRIGETLEIDLEEDAP